MSDRFLDAMRRMATLPDQRCAEPWAWEGHDGRPLQLRDGLYHALEVELGAAAAGPRPAGEASLLWTAGERAWGDLRGLLLGLPDEILDAPTAADDWSPREVLAHVLLVERRYRFQCEHALRRGPDEPVYVVPSFELGAAERMGDVVDWIERLAAERALGRGLAETDAADLERPTVWAGYDVDVRFRLGRFAAHIAEHTIQAEKALDALGWRAGEAARIVRRISLARADHELFTPPGEREALDARHAALAGQVTASQGQAAR